ncbi:uncharacterized protein LOC119873391 isoform X4 [Canis lupus familiaris]|uniref:uncharacterized protein LOC118355661 n=1 Tax=Canis lupus dingo TaxID=286419 RepID=UPI0018F41F54|nr:uncharacterized protein LOC119873391 isoform X3 [Canis lupus familiaris]XP_038477866.1 uncharacterized protein LOC119873391 isoform X4 [Canis lupus familiaris]XP_048971011.1 uncharacterized protein LOC118355661 [Canis lupus dingo]
MSWTERGQHSHQCTGPGLLVVDTQQALGSQVTSPLWALSRAKSGVRTRSSSTLRTNPFGVSTGGRRTPAWAAPGVWPFCASSICVKASEHVWTLEGTAPTGQVAGEEVCKAAGAVPGRHTVCGANLAVRLAPDPTPGLRGYPGPCAHPGPEQRASHGLSRRLWLPGFLWLGSRLLFIVFKVFYCWEASSVSTEDVNKGNNLAIRKFLLAGPPGAPRPLQASPARQPAQREGGSLSPALSGSAPSYSLSCQHSAG